MTSAHPANPTCFTRQDADRRAIQNELYDRAIREDSHHAGSIGLCDDGELEQFSAARDTVLQNTIAKIDTAHWSGQAGDFLHRLAKLQSDCAGAANWTGAAHGIRVLRAELATETDWEHLVTSRMAVTKVIRLADASMLAYSEPFGWSQLTDPEDIAAVVNDREQEREWLRRHGIDPDVPLASE